MDFAEEEEEVEEDEVGASVGSIGVEDLFKTHNHESSLKCLVHVPQPHCSSAQVDKH